MYAKQRDTRVLKAFIVLDGRVRGVQFFTDEIEAVKFAERNPMVARVEDSYGKIVWERD